MQPEMKPCKAEILKGKKESSMQKQWADLKSGRNNEFERGNVLTILNGKEIKGISNIG